MERYNHKKKKKRTQEETAVRKEDKTADRGNTAVRKRTRPPMKEIQL